MRGIIVHWTAGAHKASALDREHYHVLIEGGGKLVRGIPSIALNQKPASKGYAAHTLKCNSGFIGVALCCMAGAIEAPFNAGVAPMTRSQWDALPFVLADLCRFYAIGVTPRTVLSHAEVQPTLGIAQRGKWDITRLAFDPSIKGAKACGDLFRAATAKLLALETSS
jgi:N-acetyl-anhydromuramyl-L-alanine amidase AmpD